MSLNIKDERIHDLVREAASSTGLSQTRVVEKAITDLLGKLDAEGARSGLDELLERVYLELSASEGPLDFDSLYDPSTGLPR